ncbi:transmembrane protein 256 homolog [Anopheles ziemanni]|uniref:transmembrane protein 256 homolog n=1 Tax=Anopheles coustani TaxID=139045 RepID=UPI00265B30D8|nr:transmembrane protein 256 homolog [Anopheles coustani]XP_058168822.1 transmembrane protein 256 homolog [Anopheles ziemanni]
MGLNDAVNYVLFNNPVSSGMWSIASHGAKAVGLKPKAIAQTAATQSTAVVQQALPPLWKLLGHNRHILRLAGLSGAAAVMLGAYGAHYHFPANDEEGGRDQRQVFEMTNRYHFIHSLALLAAPLARRPYLTSLLLTSGMALFCGSCYYIAFTNDRTVGKITPVGGFMLIFGWLSFII